MRPPLPALAPARGPLAAAVVRVHAPPGGGPRLVYADLDLAERAGLRLALGLPAADDETLVLGAYRRWGAEAAAHLGGQFAFAIWDPDRRRLVAARDPVGLRPLFWSRTPEAVVLGGDLRALLATGLVADELDEGVMAAVLVEGHFVPATVGETCLRDVQEVRGGHTLVAGPEGVQHARYWHPEATPRIALRDPEEIGEALRAILREVIAEAVADEPAGTVGVHLSSGIDSTTVAALAAEALAAGGAPPPRAFSWHPPPPTGAPLPPEYARIEAAAARWGLPLTYAPTDPEIVFESRILDVTRDPVTMWAAEEPTRRAAREAGVRVLLTGWGGDEAISYSGRGLVAAHLLRTGRWGPVAAAALRDPVDAIRRARQWRSRVASSRGLSPLDAARDAALRGEVGTFAWPDLLRRAVLPSLEEPPIAPHAYMGWLLRHGHLGARAGSWARAGAPYGLHYRYPLLDRRVLALALALPDAAWLTRDRRRRWPLRAAAAGLIPESVRLGPKDEPLWVRGHQLAAAGVGDRVAPLVTLEAAGTRRELIDVAGLRAGLDAASAGPATSAGAAWGGFQATGYLGLADAHGLPIGRPPRVPA